MPVDTAARAQDHRVLTARGTLAALAAWLIVLAAPSVASADVFTVNTTLDANDNVCEGIAAGDCPLRAAVNDAANGDTINVPAGNYLLTVPGGVLLVDVSVTIAGAGARQTVINANNASRVIHVIPPSPTAPIEVGVSGVTLTNGNGVGGNNANGGALHVAQGATVVLTDSAVTNSRSQSGNGGGIYADGHLGLNRVTVSGNQANTTGGIGNGGGIYHSSNNDPLRAVQIVNSTISGNSATGDGGGIYSQANFLALRSTTIAGNTAAANGSALYKSASGGSLEDSILAAASGAACAGAGLGPLAGSNNLATDATCGGTAGVGNPLLAALANNGGPTDTHALGAGSPAIGNASPARCSGTDQRGVARPQGAACDIGAFELAGSSLTVTTSVTNDDGGEDGPGDFTVRVQDAAGADVPGSPAPGNAGGTTYALAPGTFTVSADGPNLYTLAIGGACSTAGTVTVAESQALTCTVIANDRPPQAGRSVGVLLARGTVRIRRPCGTFSLLREGDLLPNGTTIDTLRGRVTLIAAANNQGRESKADFYDGVFRLRQSGGRRPLTTLTLTERLSCPRANNASTAQRRKKKRRLWGDGSGRFRTNGKHSAATVVGTRWLVEDRCKSTLTRVVRGKVSVRDFVKKKTITVRRGKRYIARAKR